MFQFLNREQFAEDNENTDYDAVFKEGVDDFTFTDQNPADLDQSLHKARANKKAMEIEQHRIDDVNGARLNPANKQARDNGEYMGTAAQDPIANSNQQGYTPSQQLDFDPRDLIIDPNDLQAFIENVHKETPTLPSIEQLAPSAPRKKRKRDETFGNEPPNFLQQPNNLPQLQSQYITQPDTANKRPCLESDIEQRVSPPSPMRGRNKRVREEDTQDDDDVEGRAAKRHHLG